MRIYLVVIDESPEAEIALRLCRRSEHRLPAHANRLHRRARLLAAEPSGKVFIEEGERHRNRVRHLHGGRRQAGDRRHAVEDLFQRQILAAQNIPISRRSPLQRDNVHARNFSYIDIAGTPAELERTAVGTIRLTPSNR